jgi:hypothetical protein
MRIAPLGLRDRDREKLVALTRSTSAPAGLAQRARIVLLAADGVPNTEIARRTGVSRQTVISWRARYDSSGAGGLSDRPRSGRPRTLDHAQIVTAELTSVFRAGVVLVWSRWCADLIVVASGGLRCWSAWFSGVLGRRVGDRWISPVAAAPFRFR